MSAFAVGFDIAALVLFAAVAGALFVYDRVVGADFRVLLARFRLVLTGAAVFAAVNVAAALELVLALWAGAGTPAEVPPSVPVHGAMAAVAGAALAWWQARRGAERTFDAQLVRLTGR
jgi:hypothetical protein